MRFIGTSFGSQKLSQKARIIFGDASAGNAAIVAPHIVLAELFWVFQKLGHAQAFPGAVARMQSSPAFRLQPATVDDLIQLGSFLEIPEMHDRLIAIQASRLGAPVITRDASIRASPRVQCVW